AAAEDVELLTRLGLGGVGEEGELDLGHGRIVAFDPCRGITQLAAAPARFPPDGRMGPKPADSCRFRPWDGHYEQIRGVPGPSASDTPAPRERPRASLDTKQLDERGAFSAGFLRLIGTSAQISGSRRRNRPDCSLGRKREQKLSGLSPR